MDTTLGPVTIISLLLACAMAIVTRQRLGAERRRSDARLAELTAGLARPGGRAGSPADAEPPPRGLFAGVAAPGEGPMEPRVRPGQVAAPAATAGGPSPRIRRESVAPRLPFAAPDRQRWGGDTVERSAGAGGDRERRCAEDGVVPGAPAGGAGRLRRGNGADSRRIGWAPRGAEGDDGRAGSPPWRWGLARIPPPPTHRVHRAAAVVVATILVAGVCLTERAPLSRVGPYLAERTPVPGVGAYLAGLTPAPRAGADLPVELLSLDHRRQGDYLAVSGWLRNPPGGRERSRLSIAATVFDRAGAVIGTGQTPLPAAVLPAGEETAFTISLPSADRIGRYRVSFMEDRSRLPHVDRRGPKAGAPAASDARP